MKRIYNQFSLFGATLVPMIESLVFFSIGGNLGDRLSLIEETTDFIDFNIGDIVIQSKIYETPAWGMDEGTPSFYNKVLGVKTNLSVKEIKKEIEEIDAYYGRERSKDVYLNREMDVDLLMYKNESHEEHLIVPHPRMHERAFVLIPLAEIAPDLIHPQLNKTIQELAHALEEKPELKIIR